ncbi:MAG: hypothetical protein IIB43_09030 [Candidatus Marinimicrobia bacterium]|nr:hypothetical protein [Candidatus Neomarinimicrobiota bacterium]
MNKQHTDKEGHTMDTQTAKALGRDFYLTPNSKAIPATDEMLIAGMSDVDGFNKRIKSYKAWLAGWIVCSGQTIGIYVVS